MKIVKKVNIEKENGKIYFFKVQVNDMLNNVGC